jgi:hypothetical protein
MSLSEFDGETFVAFMDISGFKNLMQEKKAQQALTDFYEIGFEALTEQNNQLGGAKVEGLFVSDCGVLFYYFQKNRKNEQNHNQNFVYLLEVIRKINRKMSEKNLMLTTSVAFGDFKYQDRFVVPGVAKEYVIGQAYVDAYLNTETPQSKKEPGLCRILTKKLPEDVILRINDEIQNENTLNLIRKRANDGKHFFYYWMCNDPSEISAFEKEYCDSYKLRYTGILQALKRIF